MFISRPHVYPAPRPTRSAGSLRLQKLLISLAGCILLLVVGRLIAFAAPVAPDPVQLRQPTGLVITAHPFGDESASGYEFEGYTILQDSRTRNWVYAERGPDGRLTPGRARAGIDARPAGLPPSLRNPRGAATASTAPEAAAPAVWSGSFGSGKVLIIVADFTPSTSRGTTDAAWNQLFFSTTPGVRSVKSFYEQASFGNYTMDPVAESYGTANDGVVDVTLPYANPYPWAGDEERTSVRDTLLAADPYVDFAALDMNHNGSLDNTELHLVLIVRGFEESYGGTGGACTPNVWGHRASMQTGTCAYCAPVLDGVTVGASAYNGGYTREGEWHEFASDGCDGSAPGHMATMGIMTHELGHDIDWPDLYDIDYSSSGVGEWSIMSGGSWGRAPGDLYSGQTPVLPDAFLKWYQHWITPTPIKSPQSAVAIPNSAQNATAYLLGANPNGVDWDFGTASGTGEYFLVENRQQVGYDAGLYGISSSAKGCLIWHVDETRTSTNNANADETRKLVDLEEADSPPQNLDLASGSGGNDGDAGDPWPGTSSRTTFNAASDPNTNYYDGSTSGIAVTNISTAGTGCTVDFSGAGPAWTGAAGTGWSAASNWTTARMPNQNDNTVIPGGAPSAPNVDASAAVYNLNVLNGAHVDATAGTTLDVYGDWNETGSGEFVASAGTVVFRGSAGQTITTGATSHFNNLQIGSGSTTQTVTAGSDLDVNGNLSIQMGAKLAAGIQTIRVGGNWTDNPFSFVPGSGSVVLDGASQTVQRAADDVPVYSNDLTYTTGWKTYDPNGGGYWAYSTSTAPPNSPDHGLHARYFYNASIAADDWLFSPGFTLQAGVTYAVRFNYGAYGSSWPERLAAHIGAAQTVAAMTTQLFDNNDVRNTVWQQGSGTFTPGITGVYYVGFHCYSLANRAYPAVDDLVVTALQPKLQFYNLSVAGAGPVTLSDDATVQNNVTVNAGSTLALAGYSLTAEGAVTNNGALSQVKTVNVASTQFLNLKNLAGTADKYWGVRIEPGSSNLGSTTVTVRGNQFCPPAQVGVRRCFDVAPTTAQTSDLTFYYTEAERNGANNADIMVFHWNGSNWDTQGGTTTRGGSGDAQWARVTGVSAYSPFALNNTPLAVDLAGFAGAVVNGQVLLTWETVSEQDNAGFNVYRATAEQGPWVQLNATLLPSATPGAAGGQTYRWVDTGAEPGARWYLLEAVDLRGATARYGPVHVDLAGPNALTITEFRGQWAWSPQDWLPVLRRLIGGQ